MTHTATAATAKTGTIDLSTLSLAQRSTAPLPHGTPVQIHEDQSGVPEGKLKIVARGRECSIYSKFVKVT